MNFLFFLSVTYVRTYVCLSCESSSYHATFFSLSVNLLASCQVKPDPEFLVVKFPNNTTNVSFSMYVHNTTNVSFSMYVHNTTNVSFSMYVHNTTNVSFSMYVHNTTNVSLSMYVHNTTNVSLSMFVL